MTHSKEFQDTRPLDAQAEQAGGCAAASASADARPEEAGVGDFSHTEPHPRDDLDPRLWSEAADGRCSDEAAQFAASQPAPLSIV